MTGLFDKIRNDVQKGIEEGIAVVKGGANVVTEKMGALTAEGKRQYKMFDLRAKIQSHMTELGGRAYDVMESKKSPAADSKVNAVYLKIKKLEGQLSKLEEVKEAKAAAAPRKPAVKANATRKNPPQAAAKKKTTTAAKKVPAKQS